MGRGGKTEKEDIEKGREKKGVGGGEAWKRRLGLEYVSDGGGGGRDPPRRGRGLSQLSTRTFLTVFSWSLWRHPT